MHKQDTARLNANALAEQLRRLALKQWWVARQIGVDTKTVNRWLTGKVKRISRDNLERLSGLLGCPADELCFADEADILATRSEQNAASESLLTQNARQLFHNKDEFALYESLLKATMHPDMTVRRLSHVYKELMLLCAAQNRLEDAGHYAELALEHSARCGETAVEVAARMNLILLDAQSGRLREAAERLEQHCAFCESIGELRGLAVASINQAHLYRLFADFRQAIRAANRALAWFSDGAEPAPFCGARVNAALIARDLGWLDEARGILLSVVDNQWAADNERYSAVMRLHLLEMESLTGNPGSLVSETLAIAARLSQATYFGQSYHPYCAAILRRAGELAPAWEQTELGLAAAITREYEHPLLWQEQARILVQRGDRQGADALLEQANAAFRAHGMGGRVTDDPAADVPRLFAAPTRLRIRV